MSSPKRNEMKKLLLPALLLLIMHQAVAQSTLYVSPTGVATNPGTLESPTTLQHALTAIASGGTIFMRGGTYSYSATILIARSNSGSAGSLKKIYAYTNEIPVLSFAGMAVSGSNRGIVLDALYWHLRGLIIQGAGDNGILLSGNNNIVESCIFRNNADTGLQLSRYTTSYTSISQWPSNNLILNCEAYDNKDPGNENADGFAAKLTCGTGNIFRNCVAHHNIDDGWDLYTKSDTGPIGAITLENCIAHSNGTLTTGISSGNGDKNGFKLGGEDIGVNHIIRRCIAYNNGKHGFTYNRNLGSMEVSNNSAYNNAERNFNFDGGTSVFKNNLSYFSSSHTNDRIIGTQTGTSNAFWTNNASANFTVTSADFVSLTPGANANPTGNGFLNLAAGSDLINAGVITSGITYAGSAPDIGAVESGSTTTTYTLSVSASPAAGGSVSRSPNTSNYAAGTIVTLTANPASGYVFSGWSGSISGTSNPVTLTMDGNKSVTATFTQTATNYTLSTSVTGQGSVSPASGTFASGTNVTLTATPASGWQFSNWSGSVTGSTNPVTLTMNSNKSVTAIFTQTSGSTSITLQENATGFCSVNGTVDSNNAGFTGAGFANTTNAAGTGVMYKVAFSSAGAYTFTYRYASISSRPARLLINGATVISTIDFPPTGSWTSWATVSASATISAGTHDVRLEAIGSEGLGNIDYLQVTGTTPAAASCTATTTYTLTTAVTGQGSVNPANGTFTSGTYVTLTATPASGWQFSNWSGNVTGATNPVTITMDGNKSVAATFTQISSTSTIRIEDAATPTSGYCSVDGSRANSFSGASNGYYLNLSNSSGKGINWRVSAPASGTYTLTWRYANGGTQSATTARVLVNGTQVLASVSFPKTTSWSTWSTSTATVALPTGESTIRLETIASSEFANIDWIEVTGNNPQVASCGSSARQSGTSAESFREEEHSSASLNLSAYPNPAKELLTIQFELQQPARVSFVVYNLVGQAILTSPSTRYEKGVHTTELNVGKLKGVYILSVDSENQKSKRRFVVE